VEPGFQPGGQCPVCSIRRLVFFPAVDFVFAFSKRHYTGGNPQHLPVDNPRRPDTMGQYQCERKTNSPSPALRQNRRRGEKEILILSMTP